MALVDFNQVRVTPTLHWLEAFGLWLKQTPTAKRRQRSENTIQSYLYDVRDFSAYSEQINQVPFSLGGLNSTDLKAYFAALAKSAKPATYNRRHASLSMLVHFARQEGLIDYDPMEWIPRMEAVRKSPRDLNSEERTQLEAAAVAGEDTLLGLRDSLIFFLMSNAGLRIHEVVNLKLTDLRLEEGCIHVYGKGGKHRDVNIGGRLLDKLRAWLRLKPASVEETLFGSLTTGQARRRFYIIRDAAGLGPYVTPHAMRHTYIYRFMDAVMNGDPWRLPVAIDAVCQQTGDKPEVILAYYTRARESDMRAAAEML